MRQGVDALVQEEYRYPSQVSIFKSWHFYTKLTHAILRSWPNNHADIELADGSRTDEYKGSVFLLPTVSESEAKETFPGFHTCDVPSKIPYLRLVKEKDVAASS